MRKERGDVRIEPELLEELDIIAQRRGQSRSSMIRDAVETLVMEEKDGWNSTAIKVNISNRLADRVQQRILNADVIDLDEAVRDALKAWVKKLENFNLKTKYELDAITAENVKNDTTKAQLENAGKQLARK